MSQLGKILIVDDNLELAENVGEILGCQGWDAEWVGSAEEALERLPTGDYRGVLTDFRLPGQSGIQLVRELRAAGHTLPVVMMSAFADTDVVSRAEEAGALDVLGKPIDFERLFRLLDELNPSVRTVLVVEDDRHLADNVAEALKRSGVDPVAVGNSAEAALSMRVLPKVALLDVRLPDKSGIDLARQLLARDPSCQVVFITGYPVEAQLAAQTMLSGLRQLGSRIEVLSKPVDLDYLVLRILQTVGQ